MRAVKIAHLQVGKPESGGRIAAIVARIERMRGVAGVVVVRSMGLLSVLYDERRTDPVVISDAAVTAGEEPVETVPVQPTADRKRDR